LPAGTNVDNIVTKLVTTFKKYAEATADAGAKTSAMRNQAESA